MTARVLTPTTLLAAAPGPAPAPRLADLLRTGELDLPLPGRGDTAARWRALAAWGRADLSTARLAEGHTDAVAVLAEAGHEPVPGALYGVWAARSGGTGAVLAGDVRGGPVLRGTVRFCSGARELDRALVVALGPEGSLVVDVDLRDPRVVPRPGTWLPPGMRATDSLDVELHDVPVGAVIGGPGSYTGRPGFWWGGAGVAAVWLGGAAGVVDDVVAALRDGTPDAHQLAHLGALHAALTGTDAVLAALAAAIDADPSHAHRTAVWTARACAEQTARDVLDRAPRVLGAAGLSRDPGPGERLADLGVFVRQFHGERDLAELGRALLDGPALDGPALDGPALDGPA